MSIVYTIAISMQIDKDFDEQSNVLIHRLAYKGYKKEKLVQTKNEGRKMDKGNLFAKKRKENNGGMEYGFVTEFSRDYRGIEKIVKQHWPICLKYI